MQKKNLYIFMYTRIYTHTTYTAYMWFYLKKTKKYLYINIQKKKSVTDYMFENSNITRSSIQIKKKSFTHYSYFRVIF